MKKLSVAGIIGIVVGASGCVCSDRIYRSIGTSS